MACAMHQVLLMCRTLCKRALPCGDHACMCSPPYSGFAAMRTSSIAPCGAQTSVNDVGLCVWSWTVPPLQAEALNSYCSFPVVVD